jgi:Arc/MetJ-type ribon-helix-helix transcriptional regulator
MADTITIRTDDETEHALEVLTRDGGSRSAAVRQAVLEAASRRERAAEMRRDVLRMNLGQPDGVNVAAELARDRADDLPRLGGCRQAGPRRGGITGTAQLAG